MLLRRSQGPAGHMTMVYMMLLLNVPGSASQLYNASRMSHEEKDAAQSGDEVTGITLRVTSLLVRPYLSRCGATCQSSAHTLSGYEGFIPDLLNLITARTGIKFDLYLVPDGRYGNRKPDGSWNGMIGEVIKRTVRPSGSGADLAAAPVTITSVRLKVVDFLSPVQHLGISIVYQRPGHKAIGGSPVQFQIFSPLSPSVWIIILSSFLGVSLLLCLMKRINPNEGQGRQEVERRRSASSDIFGALWFTFTILQWQENGSSPRSFGSRILAGFWFMFVTITMVTYTGSLINNLFWASTHYAEPFKDLEGLVRRPDYRYGCVDGGNTFTYLIKNGKGKVFDDIRQSYVSGDGRFVPVRSNEEGYNTVRRDDKYTFLIESLTARYLISQRPCNLMMTHKLFAKRAYGLAIRNNTDKTIRESLHGAVMELREEGYIEALEEKWFDQGECPTVDQSTQETSLLFLNTPAVVSVSMFWGPLVILLTGIILSVAVTSAEVIYHKWSMTLSSGNQPPEVKLDVEDGGIQNLADVKPSAEKCGL